MYRSERVILTLAIFLVAIHVAQSSAGDRSQFFVNCMKGCLHKNCTDGMASAKFTFYLCDLDWRFYKTHLGFLLYFSLPL